MIECMFEVDRDKERRTRVNTMPTEKLLVVRNHAIHLRATGELPPGATWEAIRGSQEMFRRDQQQIDAQTAPGFSVSMEGWFDEIEVEVDAAGVRYLRRVQAPDLFGVPAILEGLGETRQSETLDAQRKRFNRMKKRGQLQPYERAGAIGKRGRQWVGESARIRQVLDGLKGVP